MTKLVKGLLDLSAWPSERWRKRIGRVMLGTAFCEFVVQFATDVLRGLGCARCRRRQTRTRRGYPLVCSYVGEWLSGGVGGVG